MTSSVHTRQPNSRNQASAAQSIDINQTNTHRNNTHRHSDAEFASFESTRTDLSLNSRDVVIADQWIVLGRIGEGSFGEVFEGKLIIKRYYHSSTFLSAFRFLNLWLNEYNSRGRGYIQKIRYQKRTFENAPPSVKT